MGAVSMNGAYADAAQFRLGMRQLASSVAIVTTIDGGQLYGITATSTASVSEDPPLLSIGINKQSWISEALMRSRIFCVSILGTDHMDVAEAFSRGPRDKRFDTGDWTTIATGAPALSNALAVFDCELFTSIEVKTHHLVLGGILGIRAANASTPLLYRDGRYLTATEMQSTTSV